MVCPVYNEELGIKKFLEVLSSSLIPLSSIHDFQILLVNDGSTDETVKVIQNCQSPFKINVVNLSRNFGHQAAVWCGLNECRIDSFSIVMDADLQDPPSLIGELSGLINESADVILMKRRSRIDSVWKRTFAVLFYFIQHVLTDGTLKKNVGDFFCLSPRARQTLLQYTESVKFIRGLITEIGFEPVFIEFDRKKREIGKTHYTIKQMFMLALSSITGFTIKPLILVVYGALFGSLLSIVTIFYVLYLNFISDTTLQPGWSFLAISLLWLSALILISLATLSLYLARAIQELKNRPIFTIKDKIVQNGNTSIEK